MNAEVLKERIVEILGESGKTPMTGNEMATALTLRGRELKKLQSVLQTLTREGQIVCIRGNRYTLGCEASLVTGTLQVARSGNGFVESGDVTVFVASENIGTALHGDRVIARIETGVGVAMKPGGPEGVRRLPNARVIRILERSRRDIVGTLKSTGRFLYVLPINPAYQKDFYVPNAGGAAVGDRVVARFTAWPNRHVNPEAEVIEVLGPSDLPSVDTVAILRQYGFEERFPDKVVEESESVSARMDRPGRRDDLRKTYILTIDPLRARDYDDALSLEKDAEGNRVLGVHIADVSYFVRRGDALDKEARRRGNSVYLPDKVVPMLPEQLSNGVCSLRPGVDRLVVSAFLTFDNRGEVIKRRFSRSVIRSTARLTYEQVMEALDAKGGKGGKGPSPHHMAEDSTEIGKQERLILVGLDALAQQLRKRRFARHALDLDVPECEVEVAPDGTVSNIRLVRNDRSHQLIEECMIAANEAVAVELANRQIPSMARLHKPPKPEKIEVLSTELVSLGYAPGDLRKPANLSRFLKLIKDDPLAHHVRVAVLKSMNRAVYSAGEQGHFGLAKAFYSHFTSPIRRYPDLVLHRLLVEAVLSDGRTRAKPPRLYAREELVAIAEACSHTEREAEEAERTLIEIKKCRYLAQELTGGTPRKYDAVVAAVMTFGMFVEVLDLQVQGLVHISGISEQFVQHDRNRGTLRAKGKLYKVGTNVKVRVSGVDLDKRQIDFALA